MRPSIKVAARVRRQTARLKSAASASTISSRESAPPEGRIFGQSNGKAANQTAVNRLRPRRRRENRRPPASPLGRALNEPTTSTAGRVGYQSGAQTRRPGAERGRACYSCGASTNDVVAHRRPELLRRRAWPVAARGEQHETPAAGNAAWRRSAALHLATAPAGAISSSLLHRNIECPRHILSRGSPLLKRPAKIEHDASIRRASEAATSGTQGKAPTSATIRKPHQLAYRR